MFKTFAHFIEWNKHRLTLPRRIAASPGRSRDMARFMIVAAMVTPYVVSRISRKDLQGSVAWRFAMNLLHPILIAQKIPACFAGLRERE